MKKHNLQEEIDNYLLGLMTGEERTAFEGRMASSKALQKEVQLTRQIIKAFESEAESDALEQLNSLSSEQELKDRMAEWEEDKKGKGTGNNRRRLYYLASAVAAAAILIIAYVGMQPEYTAEELFADYYAPHEYAPTIARGGETDKEYQRQAQALYDIICMIDSERAEDAIEALKESVKKLDGNLQQAAEWNLALAYLKTHRRADARQTLRTIRSNQGARSNDAYELLEIMSRKKWF